MENATSQFAIVEEIVKEREVIFNSRGFVLTEEKVHNLPDGGQSLRFEFHKMTPKFSLTLSFVAATDQHWGGFVTTLYNASNDRLNDHRLKAGGFELRLKVAGLRLKPLQTFPAESRLKARWAL